MRRCLAILVLFFFIPWGWAGTKEELIRLQSDVLQLQNQVRLLQKSFDDQNGTMRSLLEQLNDQTAKTNRVLEEMVKVLRDEKADFRKTVSDLHQEIQGLSVKLDDTNNRLASLHQKVEESQMRVETRRLPSASDPGGAKPDQVYSLAFNDYLGGNYELAIRGFQDFLVNYPESEYTDNAAYYLGLCYQHQGRSEQALQAFDQVINLYPKGDMAPSAYYKKALLEQEQQKNEAAIETYRKLITLFPNSQEAVIASQELEGLGIDTSKLRRHKKR
ncbi:MAG: tol-pal system protein YbgF [Acidobacteriota bacterium]